MATKDDVPTFDKLINPTLRALHKLGGSASIHELGDEIVSDMKLPPEVAELLHGRGSQTEVEYRAAWARTCLKNYGLIENSERGVWALTAGGRKAKSVDARTVVKTVQQKQREARQARETKKQAPVEENDQAREERGWREQILDLLQAMDPAGFERLCQRLLRESGFIEVDVTGRSGDGGIDGRGTIRIGGLISFNVLFQSKRYRGNIGPDIVRDFRGAMIGRADKGLLITTGGFTREARKEAIRDGAPPIDLIDGELLIDKLKELKLGVKTSLVEHVEVTEDWFSDL
jgi:restriction system protein